MDIREAEEKYPHVVSFAVRLRATDTATGFHFHLGLTVVRTSVLCGYMTSLFTWSARERPVASI